jgi:hypothetical protein
MLFPTHLVAGWVLARRWRLAPLPVVAGAALPDLLDKPLAMVGVVDLFHTVGHSLVMLPVLLAGALAWGRLREGSAAGWGIVVGWASHLLLDAVHVVINGRPEDAVFLAWPALVPADPFAVPPVPFAVQYVGSPSFYLEVVIYAAAVAAYLSDGSGDDEE